MNLYPKVFLVKALAETIFYAKLNYYQGQPTLSDETYDRIEEGLKSLCPNHPILQVVGEPSFDKHLLGLAPTHALVRGDENLEDIL